jgi:hypothetical protein
MSDRFYRTVENELIDGERSVETGTVIVPTGPNPEPTVMSMFQQAMDRGLTPEETKQWMALRKEWIQEQAELAFNAAFNAAQKEMPPVLFNKTNTGTNSGYANLAGVNTTINPIITKHGFAVSYNEDDFIRSSKESPAEYVKFSAELRHLGGFSKTYTKTLPLDDVNKAKNKLQAMGSTISYGRRYLKLMMFDIAPQDEDNDGQTGPATISEDAVSTLNGLIGACRDAGKPIDHERFLRAVGVHPGGDLGDIHQAKFLVAVELLTKKLSARKADGVQA